MQLWVYSQFWERMIKNGIKNSSDVTTGSHDVKVLIDDVLVAANITKLAYIEPRECPMKPNKNRDNKMKSEITFSPI